MTIPASRLANITPSTLAAGGASLGLNGVILTDNELIPAGTAPRFASAAAVSAYFGAGSTEHAAAQVYFAGFTGSTIKPSVLFFAPWIGVARAAWLRGGDMSAASLATLQGLSGTLIITVDGVAIEAAAGEPLNLSAATSFSDAAALLTAALNEGAALVTWDAVRARFVFTSPTTGAESTITECSGTLAAGLKLTLTTGAVLSQGRAGDTPATACASLVAATQNWVSFTTLAEADLAEKQAFAAWANAQGSRYLYVAWDTDAQAAVNGATTPFGVVAKDLAYDGVIAVYDTVDLALFLMGSIASVDFTRRNGRVDFAFRAQPGFTPTVTDDAIAQNLLENGYSFYGSYATANDQFNWFFDGALPGPALWLDSYINTVYHNSQMQLALMTAYGNTKARAYNEEGYALLRAALQDPINQALYCGIIRAGVVLSEAQKAQINQDAGGDVAAQIESRGYYLQIRDPGAQVRAARGSPIVNYWRTDGGSIHYVNVASVNVI